MDYNTSHHKPLDVAANSLQNRSDIGAWQVTEVSLWNLPPGIASV